MTLLALKSACLAYGHVALLDHADLQLEPGERVALIGRNGTGKSSLLKVLAATAALDEGELRRKPGLRLAQVEQEPDFEPGLNVFDALIAGLGEATRSLQQYHLVSLRLAEPGADHDSLLAELGRLQAELEAHGAWTISAQTERVISRFGLPADARVDELSGGQRKRLALARAFLLEPELLLLDEPTNHLDIESIEWLEDLLVEEGPTLLFVTHDRRFLDRVATRIVELDRGRLASFPGRFSSYLQRKEQMLNAETLADQRFDKLLAQEEAWIRKGVEARRTRSAGRADRLERLRIERAARRERLGQVRLRLDAGERSGRLVAELTGVSKTFPGPEGPRRVVSNFSARILRGDRVGLIGPNGAGKTTLLRLILGELPPDSGSVRLGTNVEVAYFDQFRAQLDPEATLLDAVAAGSEWIESGDRPRHVMSYLGDFLFSPERARSPVRSLSGGERNRLLLARLFARPANVLVLDEPTNDLDIETLELLEELLDGYPGTVFLVSHDRAFLDNVVTQAIVAEGDGAWREFAGGYEDWQRQRPPPPAVARPATATVRREAPARRPDPPPRLSYKETRELAALPARIEALEAEQRQIAASFEDPALYCGPPAELQRLTGRMSAIEVELAELIERWETLELRNTK